MSFTYESADLPKPIAFIATDGRIRVTARHRRGREAQVYRREWAKPTRVYDVLDALVPTLMELEPFKDYAIPDVAPQHMSPEDRTRAAMWNSWKNQVTKEGAKGLISILDGLVECHAIDSYGEKAPRFSFTAGCSCPCSPGFILGEKLTFAGAGIDLWVDLGSN